MKIAVAGTGYVGLVTGTCFAEAGNEVVCIDIDSAKVKRLKDGQVPIYEPGLETMFHRNLKEKRLSFTTSLIEGIVEAEVIFLCLPTPPGADGSADLSYVLGVAEELGHLLKDYSVIVDKSTVPVGTAEKVRAKIKDSADIDFDVVANPEFLREGFAVDDFMKPDRIVIGTTSMRAKKLMSRLYKPFVRQGNPVIYMDERSAEMTKYAANAFLATKISFMNEVANLSEKAGADVDMVRLGIGADERIGKRFLFPGIGYGGSCFPKDVAALARIAADYAYDFKIVKAVEAVNTIQKTILAQKIMNYYKGNVKDRSFALWGLAFKPDTDDIREAPSLQIIKELTEAGARITAYDPEATENVRKLYGDNKMLHFSGDPYEVLKEADALLIATEWSEFRSPDFDRLKQNLKQPVIFDGRNLYSLEEMQEQNFYYESIGRRTIEGSTR